MFIEFHVLCIRMGFMSSILGTIWERFASISAANFECLISLMSDMFNFFIEIIINPNAMDGPYCVFGGKILTSN